MTAADLAWLSLPLVPLALAAVVVWHFGRRVQALEAENRALKTALAVARRRAPVPYPPEFDCVVEDDDDGAKETKQ